MILNKRWLGSGCQVLEELMNHQRPPRRQTVLWRGLVTIHSVATQCRTPPSRGGTWTFPPEAELLLTPWTLCSVGFPHVSTDQDCYHHLANGHRNCNCWVLVLDPLISPVHYLLLSFYSCPFFSLKMFSSDTFILWYCCIFTDSNKYS